jgi:hypothetical protein
MRLIPIPITDEALNATADHWLPFLPMIARRSKEPIATLIERVGSKEMRLVLVWDEEAKKASALVGIRLHKRGNDLIGEWLWMAGYGRKQWQHLLPELEQLLRAAGCVECRPLCRPGWARAMLQSAGYKITHVQMEKSLKTMEQSNGR